MLRMCHPRLTLAVRRRCWVERFKVALALARGGRKGGGRGYLLGAGARGRVIGGLFDCDAVC